MHVAEEEPSDSEEEPNVVQTGGERKRGRSAAPRPRTATANQAEGGAASDYGGASSRRRSHGVNEVEADHGEDEALEPVSEGSEHEQSDDGQEPPEDDQDGQSEAGETAEMPEGGYELPLELRQELHEAKRPESTPKELS